jgi:hypothetical protein
MPHDDGGHAVKLEDAALYCSFCHKSQDQVRKLVAGTKAFICDECVEICADITSDDRPAEGRTTGSEAGTPIASPLLTARCSLCRLPAAVDRLVAVVDRGAVCRPCLAAVRATSEPDDNGPRE